MKNILIFVLFVSLIIVILSNLAGKGWLIYHEGSFKGRGIDGDSKGPIEGAVVVAVYHVRKYGLGAGIMSDSSAVDAKEVLTNKKGEFSISTHVFFSFWPFASGDTTEFIIYKPGYTAFPSFEYARYFPESPLDLNLQAQADLFKKGVTVELMQLKTKKERLNNIPSSPTDMGAREMPLLYKAINEENKRFGLGEVR